MNLCIKRTGSIHRKGLKVCLHCNVTMVCGPINLYPNEDIPVFNQHQVDKHLYALLLSMVAVIRGSSGCLIKLPWRAIHLYKHNKKMLCKYNKNIQNLKSLPMP